MYNILLVEDNKNNSRLMEQLILDIDDTIELFIAESGVIALNAAKNNQFDLVIMDISLPDMDGISLTRELKKDEKFSKIPFIAATAHAMKEDEDRFLTTFEDYISKPIDDDLFEKIVRKWLGL
jgi:CheY-like chemotaxis protein